MKKLKSRQSQNQKTGGVKPVHLALVFVVGLSAWYFLMHRTPREAPNRTSTPAKARVKAVELMPEDQLAIPQHEKSLAQRRASAIEASSFNVQSLKAKAGDHLQSELAVKMQTLWCQGGDLETMQRLVPHNSAKVLLVTIEALGSSAKPLLSKQVSVKELKTMSTEKFKVPSTRGAEAYGIFICTNKQGGNQCGRKAVKSFDQLNFELAKKEEKKNRPDTILYFQPLIATKNGIQTMELKDYSDKTQSNLNAFLQKKYSLSPFIISSILKLANTLRSTAAELGEGKISIPITYNDPRCQAEATGHKVDGKKP